MGIFDFVLGQCVVKTKKKNAAKLVNICMKSEAEYWKPQFFEDDFFIECHTHTYEKIKSACEKRGLEVILVYCGGLPMVISKYKNRIGIFVGALLSIALMVYSLNTVWRIELSGNERIRQAELEELLGENGLSLGSFIPSADLTFIENSVMQSEPRIAWISININGSVANIEIRETKKGESKSKFPTNLVALRDGKIERVESYNGNCLVKTGDVVRAGDILVSGIYQNENGDYRTTHAEGEIFARTVREILVEIPFENTKKIYTGRDFYEIYINFFKKSIKVFANTGNLPPSCDIIYENGKVGLPRFPKIPIGYEKVTYSEYNTESVVLDESEAMSQAFKTLGEELELLSQSAELIRKDIEFEISDRAYILRCRLVCIENIAVTREIE